jgi:predicted site-specific integrase-resolvase
MRVIARCFGLSIILIVSIMIYAQMMMLNVQKDELVNCISTAMTSTQIIMQEQIEDFNYGTNTRRKNMRDMTNENI